MGPVEAFPGDGVDVYEENFLRQRLQGLVPEGATTPSQSRGIATFSDGPGRVSTTGAGMREGESAERVFE